MMEKSMLNPATPSDEEWLRELFEFEYCEECGGDAEHHTVSGDPLGHPHAWCKFPPDADGNQHPTIKAFRDAQDAPHTLRECDICGNLHPIRFEGDCRDNDHRYASVEDYAVRNHVLTTDVTVA
jgi:hypothetical protein